MKHQLPLGALAAALALSVLPVASASAVSSITAETGGWVAADASAPFTVALAGSTGEDLVVRIQLAEGTMSVDDTGLALTLETGFISFTDVAEISFTGSSADVTTALAERLTWTAPSTPSQSYLRLSISVGSYYAGLVVDETSGHSYLFQSGSLSWPAARDAAAALNLNGLTGYLVTITSPEENSVVSGVSNFSTHHISATSEITYVNPLLPDDEQYDNEAELRGVFFWGSGPEAGEQVTYFPWFPGDPNGFVTDRCILTNWFVSNSGPGLWVDAGCSNEAPYVVEFGGIGTDVGPALFDNLDAAAPPLDDDGASDGELADTGTEPFGVLAAAVGIFSLGALLLAGATSARSRGRLA